MIRDLIKTDRLPVDHELVRDQFGFILEQPVRRVRPLPCGFVAIVDDGMIFPAVNSFQYKPRFLHHTSLSDVTSVLSIDRVFQAMTVSDRTADGNAITPHEHDTAQTISALHEMSGFTLPQNGHGRMLIGFCHSEFMPKPQSKTLWKDRQPRSMKHV